MFYCKKFIFIINIRKLLKSFKAALNVINTRTNSKIRKRWVNVKAFYIWVNKLLY